VSKSKPACGGHIDAMLGDIGFVLVAVELNLHY
jgi:hypothetical protein